MPTQTIGPQHARELQEIADSICRSGQVLMVTGAGISTNSGIPVRLWRSSYLRLMNLTTTRAKHTPKLQDFRSSNGLYNLVKRRYPDQTALLKGRDLFDAISFTNPITTSILYSFLAELRQTVKSIPDSTPTHKFIKTLSETGRLLRCYTQNIDGLEALDGLCMDISRGAGKRGKGKEKIGREVGCEVVQLHGDLEMLRCTQCAKLHDYDHERVETLLGGDAPGCPDCSKKADDRLAAGKRSINVGTLRPNIVLYDELHPQGEAIGQLTHYDATKMTPDLLLIFGTSLKVIGLKRIVKAFAAKVKSRGGRVVYINVTAAPDSVWGDIIDYHVQMDCDAWIRDLKLRRKEIWLHQSLLDKEWKRTKLVSSLKRSKTTAGYESDKENSGKLKGQPLVRRKSLSALPSKKKAGEPKERQLPTPSNTPRKTKPKSLPATPAGSTSKRPYAAAFPPSTSPLTSLTATPSLSLFNTPSKRVRIATPLPPMNATTPTHLYRPSPAAYSWVASPRASSTRSRNSTPTQKRLLEVTTPKRPVPDSPTLTATSTPTRSGGRRFFLDHVAIPPIEETAASPTKHRAPVTPSRKRSTLSAANSVSTSARRSAQRRGIPVSEIFIERTPSPCPTPRRGRGRPYKTLEEYGDNGLAKSLPTPPDSQIPSDQDPEQQEPTLFDEDEDSSLVKYRPRGRNTPKQRVYGEQSFERLDSDVTEASEQLEREAEMASTPHEPTDDDIDDVDLVSFDALSSPPVSADAVATSTAIETHDATKPAITSPNPRVIDLAEPPFSDASTPTGKAKKKTASPAITERRRTRGLQKEEEIKKILSKPGTVTRREAERRRSLKSEVRGLVD
ncbi:hypothetical protein Dda_7206 [Drechslerella dactyloides]|uniref:Deacetylase sirtuin-type domain-containing protein n=1 Tax=Drechslerella dactyloides TaxID=74499 RepID=A0AAD6IVB6_DREDA|nr:hypothetical protein Dda_7206 [Drechslerella dactyloides]